MSNLDWGLIVLGFTIGALVAYVYKRKAQEGV